MYSCNKFAVTYHLYTRKLTAAEKDKVLLTHEYQKIDKDEFLKLLPLVNNERRDRRTGRLLVDNKWVEIFLYRLGGVQSTVDVFSFKTSPTTNDLVLTPFPPGPLEYAIIIESMRFPDGQFSGRTAEGEFALLVPRLT